jgi:peroxiredoxin Q/BCP
MVLDTGSPAPPLTAQNQWGERVSPNFDTGGSVLYFYPRDGTPGCTTQAKEFNALAAEYQSADVDIYGVSTDDVDAHCEFAERHDLTFDLLADTDREIATAFDVTVTDNRAERVSFVIASGTVVGVYQGVRPEGHAKQVLRDLKHVGVAAP